MSEPHVVPVATVLEIGRIPREEGPDEPFAMLLSFPSAEHLRCAMVALQANLKFMEPT